MQTIRKFLKKAFLPITILLVPHNNIKRFSLRLPLLGIILPLAFFLTVSGYLVSIAVQQAEFARMEKKLQYYQKQFDELNGAIQSIKKSENEFKKLFFQKSKERVLENITAQQSGSVDIDSLREQIQPTVETVKKIKEYLYRQKNIYMAMPKGLPVSGKISSPFGIREHPLTGMREFHPALDIKAEPGTPVKTTADGVVSYAGWTKGSGNLVAIEHGFGYSTYYAHNSRLTVKAGRRVHRGEVIAFVGSTGTTTGPHCHYEIREDGKPLDPKNFLETRR